MNTPWAAQVVLKGRVSILPMGIFFVFKSLPNGNKILNINFVTPKSPYQKENQNGMFPPFLVTRK